MKWQLIWCALVIFLAGVANGYHETIHYHYSQFKTKHPTANDLFWDPGQSWVNKYKNADPHQGPKFFLSTTALAWLTDAKHLFGTLFRWFLIVGVSFGVHLARPRRWQGWLILFASVFVCMGAGFQLIYTLIY